MASVSWTDYLYLAVGGTLSNAGISGQTFPMVLRSAMSMKWMLLLVKGNLWLIPNTNPQLFFAVLRGLGQFGIITRARIALEPVQKRVSWTHMFYDKYSKFSRDQKHLISINGLDYLEGSLFDHAK
ncbi:unnamed protein product, partial [Vitis vinifera]|uniref:Cytokinin dehydrogenase 1 FAD/cytokinin binding domain-containing protein n=1 Tax=Vitis vinifera TaxID=29760 RepID=D7U3H1_VITVI